MPDDNASDAPATRATTYAVLGAGALGVLSVAVPELSIFAMLAVFIGGLALPPRGAPLRRAAVAAIVVGALCTVFGLVRFTLQQAVPRIVAAGDQAAMDEAVSRLREIREAQDKARANGTWDPDGDGVGSALDLAELAGKVPLRGRTPLQDVPFLQGRWTNVVDGQRGKVACVDTACFTVFLPTTAGGAVDDEAAERRYIAYAWPADLRGGRDVFFLDEHERIFVSDGSAAGQRYEGIARMPSFDAALPTSSFAGGAPVAMAPGRDGGVWRSWRGKTARPGLVGDKTAP